MNINIDKQDLDCLLQSTIERAEDLEDQAYELRKFPYEEGAVDEYYERARELRSLVSRVSQVIGES